MVAPQCEDGEEEEEEDEEEEEEHEEEEEEDAGAAEMDQEALLDALLEAQMMDHAMMVRQCQR